MSTGRPEDDLLPQSIWRAPLVPAALAVTGGLLLDRRVGVPLVVSLTAAAGCLAAWLVTLRDRRSPLPLVYLALAGVAFGAAYHHYRRDVYAPDDIGLIAPAEPRPAQVRGRVEEEPRRNAAHSDPLASREREAYTSAVVWVTHLHHRGDWVRVSGRVRLLAVERPQDKQPPIAFPELHIGDEVEMVGRLARVQGPGNPGEFDQAAYWRDQGVLAQLTVRPAPDAVTQLARGWPTSWRGWLAVIRGKGHAVLRQSLPEETNGVASALLLGEGAPMTRADWEKYIRTGVVHVLAISGQHLAVLTFFLWLLLPRLGVRQRQGAIAVALLMLFYALLTGGRPPVMRAAVGLCVLCGALVLRHRTLPANLFAGAWLAVVLINPTEVDDLGCQLSFLCVGILYWCTRRLFERSQDPLTDRVDAARPPWLRGLRWGGLKIFESYLVCAVIWLAIAPMLGYRTNMIPVIGLLVGPPVTLFASVALLFGFPLLVLGPIAAPLGYLPAKVVHWNLAACQRLVDWGDALHTEIYVFDFPEWWIWAFYLGLFAVLTQPPLLARWRWGLAGGLGWLCVGLLAGSARLPPDELRCTFLAVGHGGCVVLEAPDGRTLLYDAGAMNGPDVTARRIAPYLWSRGIRRVDEIILSHADLDHFNGVPDLLDRFAVGQVSRTPSFADKQNDAVRLTLAALDRRRIPVRILKAGDRLSAGAVTLDVLHPPEVGPDGTENARSLVLRVRHAGHTILLTGDLEGEGLARVLRGPAVRAHVLMAPHHGSHRVDGTALAAWCRPELVVSCQGFPRGAARAPAMYEAQGARFWSTHEHGAVTVRSGPGGLVAETFRTKQRLALRPGGPGR
jgi:competence protein ComEC